MINNIPIEILTGTVTRPGYYMLEDWTEAANQSARLILFRLYCWPNFFEIELNERHLRNLRNVLMVVSRYTLRKRLKFVMRWNLNAPRSTKIPLASILFLSLVWSQLLPQQSNYNIILYAISHCFEGVQIVHWTS